MAGLSVSDVVSVVVQLSPNAIPTSNFGALLAMGSSPIIDTSQRIRQYASLTAVANDFGTSAPEYFSAALFFGQNPKPATLYIGRWAKTATSGLLHGAQLTASQQTLSNFTAITTGSTSITVNGTPHALSVLDFSAQTNLNGVASVMQTALPSATVTWNSILGRFEFTSLTTGTASTVAFGVPTGSGVDVTTLLGIGVGGGGQSIAGIAAETMLAAVNIIASTSGAWYGLVISDAAPADADIIAVAGYIEGLNSPARFFLPTATALANLDPASTTDLSYALKQLGYNQTAVQVDPNNPYSAASLFARQASVDFNANNSTITLMFKQEPGVIPLTLTETQAAAVKAKNANVFVTYQNSAAIIQFGTCASGQYIDTIVGLNWLQNAIQTAVFNLLYTNTTKIQQTDAGVNQIMTTVASTLDSAVNNGLLAPGIWNGPNIGPLLTGQTLQKGYFCYAPPIATQSLADRGQRKAPPIQAAVKLGGAIHSASVIISVSA